MGTNPQSHAPKSIVKPFHKCGGTCTILMTTVLEWDILQSCMGIIVSYFWQYIAHKDVSHPKLTPL